MFFKICFEVSWLLRCSEAVKRKGKNREKRKGV